MLYSSSKLYYVARGDPEIPSIGPLPKRPGLSYILRPQIILWRAGLLMVSPACCLPHM